mgnify:CR=1 FL=1
MIPGYAQGIVKTSTNKTEPQFLDFCYGLDQLTKPKGSNMRIAILMANTDETDFAQRHPKDGEKFTALMSLARPDWDYVVFSVKDGLFPESTTGIDGAIITGSPASVHDGEDWITKLEALVRVWLVARVPIYGVCFGHQIIAKALGGTVGQNPDGWVLGAINTVYQSEGSVSAFAAHTEQVTALPEGAEIIASTPGCPAAGYKIADQVETTQYHPEMTEAFMAALLNDHRDYFGDGITDAAEASLQIKPNRAVWAERIADFFEKSN